MTGASSSGAGYFGITFLAPVLGVICITSEYRHKTITSTLVLTPRRGRVLGAKIVVTAWWCVLMAVLSLVMASPSDCRGTPRWGGSPPR